MTLLQEKPDQKEKEEENAVGQIPPQKNLTPSIGKEDITVVKGLGPRTKKILNEAGIVSIVQLAQSTTASLDQIGIGQVTAQKIIAGAKEHIHKKNLDVYIQVEEPVEEAGSEIEPVTEDDDPFFNTEMEQEDEDDLTVSNSIVQEPTQINNSDLNSEPWFEEKFNYSRLTGTSNFGKNTESYSPARSNEAFEDQENIDKDDQDSIVNEFHKSEEFTTKSNPIKTVSQSLSKHQSDIKQVEPYNHIRRPMDQRKDNILEKLYKKVRSAEFYIIEKNHNLSQVFTGIDAIALKIIQVKEYLDIICIVPIIISKMEGTFTISEKVIDYLPLSENESRIQSRNRATSYLTSLKRAEEFIFNDFTNNGEFSKYLMKFLDINFSADRTITHKTLYLHSGPLQYEVLIEPIIVCENIVGFTEKLIPFAYMKDLNIHIVNISHVPDLLSYIDQKYFLIDTYSDKKNAHTLMHEAEYNFANEIRLASIPFTIYGFILLLLFLFQEFSILSLLINIGYGLAVLYIIVIAYIYMRLSHQKSMIKKEFAIPYHKRNLGINDSKMRLIKEQLPPKLMEQFGYEILGKNSHSPVMEQIEDDNANSYLTTKAMKRRVEKVKLFEEDREVSRSKLSSEAANRYSSFLED